VVDAAGIGAALALIVQLTGRLDALVVEGGGDFSEGSAGGPHSEHTADQGRGFLVNDEMVLVLGVPLVAVGRVGAHVFPALRAGFLDGFHFLAGVTAVKLVEQVQKAHNIGAAVVPHGVDAVVERDEAAPNGGEQVIGILTELNVVPAKPGKVFDEDDVDALGLGVSDQALNAGALEICPTVAIVNVNVDFIPALFPHIPLEQELLIFDADGFPVTLVIVAQSAIDADIVCFFDHYFTSRSARFIPCAANGSRRIAPASPIIK